MVIGLIAGAACAGQDPSTTHPTADGPGLAEAGEANHPGHTCPDPGGPPSEISTCFLGAAFAACPGEGAPPAAYCSSAARRCLWSSNGCPFGEYTIPIGPACTCVGQPCPSMFETVLYRFVMEHGSAPWTRDREMNVQVSLDPALAPTETAVTCSGCTGACIAGDNPCGATNLMALKETPGTLVVEVMTAGGLWGWRLAIEADMAATKPVARICRLPFSDALSCEQGTVVSAASGEVTFNQDPGSGPLSRASSRPSSLTV